MPEVEQAVRFVAMVSHNLRTPMGTILVATELAMTEHPMPPRMLEAMRAGLRNEAPAQIGRAAHKLRGTLVYLAEIAPALEQLQADLDQLGLTLEEHRPRA